MNLTWDTYSPSESDQCVPDHEEKNLNLEKMEKQKGKNPNEFF